MQIFIRCFGFGFPQTCKTVTLDVDPTDMVTTVKSKLEDKIGIPSSDQRLVWRNSISLDKEMWSLLDYNIQKEDTLQLHVKFKAASHNSSFSAQSQFDPGTSGLSVFDGLDWNKLASEAKFKIDQAVSKKKFLYISMMEKKKVKVEHLIKAEEEMEYYEQQIVDENGEIEAMNQKIELMRQELKKHQDLREASVRHKEAAFKKKIATKAELDGIQAKITKVEKEIKGVDVRCLDKHNEDQLVFRKFLTETISRKESELECPVCYLVSPPPLYKCLKEHLLCSKCFPRVRGKCPTCRSGFSGDNKIFRLAEQNWKELQELKSKLEEMNSLLLD